MRIIDTWDVAGLRGVFSRLPLETDRPSLIICHTVKGKGIAFAENDLNYHHLNKVSSEDAGKIAADLRSELDRLGNCWGSDEIGTAFAASQSCLFTSWSTTSRNQHMK